MPLYTALVSLIAVGFYFSSPFASQSRTDDMVCNCPRQPAILISNASIACI
jgi:hypothetical protein